MTKSECCKADLVPSNMLPAPYFVDCAKCKRFYFTDEGLAHARAEENKRIEKMSTNCPSCEKLKQENGELHKQNAFLRNSNQGYRESKEESWRLREVAEQELATLKQRFDDGPSRLWGMIGGLQEEIRRLQAEYMDLQKRHEENCGDWLRQGHELATLKAAVREFETVFKRDCNWSSGSPLCKQAVELFALIAEPEKITFASGSTIELDGDDLGADYKGSEKK